MSMCMHGPTRMRTSSKPTQCGQTQQPPASEMDSARKQDNASGALATIA
eukprot:CAMPEP_0115513880 /NCGR_PEP_ID=MMETSP0271-20121206/75324_1 /TAXON_ID=71861 /ORGANISM="Scrippsiella trochoidea, Strain CCMP3099" /LENGTH=48 /DNA_ID= /DNA_START= /DNA_END= /DNA_ORIENTATION=